MMSLPCPSPGNPFECLWQRRRGLLQVWQANRAGRREPITYQHRYDRDIWPSGALECPCLIGGEHFFLFAREKRTITKTENEFFAIFPRLRSCRRIHS